MAAALLARVHTNNSIATTYYAFCLFVFYLTELQIRPSFRSGRVTAQFFRLASINRFSLLFNLLFFTLGLICQGQKSKRHISAAMLPHGFRLKEPTSRKE